MTDPAPDAVIPRDTLLAAAGALVLDQLNKGKAVTFTVPTGSMRPWLMPGVRVKVQAVRALTPPELRRGDVVAIHKADGTWLTHRLVGRMRWEGVDCWLTKGDHAQGVDAPVRSERIAGVVVAECYGTLTEMPLVSLQVHLLAKSIACRDQ